MLIPHAIPFHDTIPRASIPCTSALHAHMTFEASRCKAKPPRAFRTKTGAHHHSPLQPQLSLRILPHNQKSRSRRLARRSLRVFFSFQLCAACLAHQSRVAQCLSDVEAARRLRCPIRAGLLNHNGSGSLSTWHLSRQVAEHAVRTPCLDGKPDLMVDSNLFDAMLTHGRCASLARSCRHNSSPLVSALALARSPSEPS